MVTLTKGVTRLNLILIIAMKELSISPYVIKETAITETPVVKAYSLDITNEETEETVGCLGNCC